MSRHASIGFMILRLGNNYKRIMWDIYGLDNLDEIYVPYNFYKRLVFIYEDDHIVKRCGVD